MPTLVPKFLLYSWLCCAHGCVYTCTVNFDCDSTIVPPTPKISAGANIVGVWKTKSYLFIRRTLKNWCWSGYSYLSSVELLQVKSHDDSIFHLWNYFKNLGCDNVYLTSLIKVNKTTKKHGILKSFPKKKKAQKKMPKGSQKKLRKFGHCQ